jgi:two-component system LytT family response regulator
MLAAEKDIELLGEFTDGHSGSQAVREHQPQLLFLGVRLGSMNGFDLLKSTNHPVPPAVIFASPHEQYAVRAFDVHAVDYLLKPFTRERFQKAVARARIRIRQKHERPTEQSGPFPQFIGVKSGRNIVLLRPAEIHSIVASRGHCTITAEEQTCRTRTSLAGFRTKLPPGVFVRINRTTLINAQLAQSITRKGHGDARLRLASGREFALSRRYRALWSVLLSAQSSASK